MTDLLFLTPIQKKDPRKPTWHGIPRVALTRPAVAAEIDPVKPEEIPVPERKTRDSLQIGTIVIILDGEFKGKRGVVFADNGKGIVKVNGPAIKPIEIDQDFLIATSTKLEIGNVDEASSAKAIDAAAEKIPEMADYLKATFSLRPGDRPHLMKF
ncbi:60S ribosomal protein L6 [Histomonas meleagridis]|uniref:60S ribosomal protein L6 n=1 Tax=Histomonas meleagridis TaxID=135588 RepID=UPI00355956AD|nr:60S ribosomal protein L6 [Histomonas meleagridis]KAH0805416.1 60S ribosomal protein L6 [Histomonas meleagridis]